MIRHSFRRLRDAWVWSGADYDPAPPPPSPLPRRDDHVTEWIKRQRDQFDERHDTEWDVLDNLLYLYLLHADLCVPLAEHICESTATGGECDCLERPTRSDDE
ncbi:hypothetical protein [Streptomyces sp. NPDC059994]|uniref:hypothetical protein n=1 Tax=Streptomyces sp. NPDC059994 TaxID=3347029 RepID=UPI0036D1B6E8